MAKKYIELYKKIRSEIVSGVYKYNDRLPSKRTLSDTLNISVVTVERAYSILCDEGYVTSKAKSGYFVIYRVEDSFSVPAESPVLIPLKSESFENAAFPFSVFSKRARYVLTQYGEMTLQKTDNEGLSYLRREISEYLARNRGIFVKPEQIIIGSGAEYLYSLVAKLFPDSVFGTEKPSYAKIQSIYEHCGVKCEPLLLGKHGILTSELNSTKADVLHITPYRSYPTGVTATASKRREYLEWVSKAGKYIVEDDYESEFSVSAKVEDTLFATDETESIIYINTFSKTISPSLRIAYMLLPDKLVTKYNEKMGFLSCTASTFDQYLTAELLSNGDFERHINKVRRLKRKELSDN